MKGLLLAVLLLALALACGVKGHKQQPLKPGAYRAGE